MNRNDQQAYDRGTSLFSPDGRIYQVEYAREAVSRGAASIGVRTTEGVVLVGQNRMISPLMEAESVEKLHKLDDHLGAASAGHVADARRLVDYARRVAQGDRLRYGETVDVETLAKHVTDLIQENTQTGGTRPFGASLLLGGIDNGGQPRLFATDPSGTPNEWKAVAIGGDQQTIQEYLEEHYVEDLTLADGVSLALQALAAATDAEDLGPDTVSVTTVAVADGYRALSGDEIESNLAELDTDDE
jgi:proteasome alpha subunit